MVFFLKVRKKTRWVVALVFFSAITQIVANKLIPSYKNLFYNSNVVLELIFLTAFFWGRFTNKSFQYVFKSSVILCGIIGTYSLLNNDMINVFLNKWVSINNLVFTTWILLLVYTYYKEDLSYFKQQPSLPYFFVGIFLYNCATIFVYPAWDYVIYEELKSLIPVHAVFNTLMYLLLFIGLYVEIRYILSVKKQQHE